MNTRSGKTAVFGKFQPQVGLMDRIADVLNAKFFYNNANWKSPALKYAVNDAGQGVLLVKQWTMRHDRTEWVIRLNQKLPTDMKDKLEPVKRCYC